MLKSIAINGVTKLQRQSFVSGIISEMAQSKSRASKHPNVESNTAEELSEFPRIKTNTVMNIGRQSHQYVIERFGKFSRVANPGIYFTIPFLERIYQLDTRQQVIDVNRQNAYTSDNVSVSVAAQLYITVVDVKSACYKVSQPLVAVVSQAQSALRTAIGKCDLDHLLKDRNSINVSVGDALQHSVEQWGISVSRFEITELVPDKRIQEAMDLQSIAERERRAMVTSAEGKRQAMETEAQGKRIAIELEATAKKMSVELEAEATANAAKQLERVSDKVLAYWVSNMHIKMVNELSKHSKHNTYFVNKDITTLPALSELFNVKKE